jgi:serpin B
MTYAGAEGVTARQMAQTLHFSSPKSQLNPAFKRLEASLNGSDAAAGLQLRVANRLWGQQGFHFLPAFLQTTRDNYGAELGALDFKQPETARREINAWIDEHTEHKIQDLIAPGVLDASTRLVLTNAIYFKANWTSEFSKSHTTDAPFHLPGGQQITVPLMQQTHRFRYAEAEGMQLLELPYGRANQCSMLILLPKQVDGLSAVEKQLTYTTLQRWSASLQSRQVRTYLPKFKLTAEFELSGALGSLGMPLAFSQQADFSGMCDQEKLFISAVIHKAFVDVNEEGTEAAAATAVAMRAMAIRPSPEEPVEFRADRPFVFLIRDQRTDSILFLGRLANPQS